MIDGKQRLHNIRTKVRLLSDRHWRTEGWGICTGDLERDLIVKELDRLLGRSAENSITSLVEIP